ncbi:flagellar transcriptional activator FlhD [Gilliamella intestini]|uniref:Flagellar transcriptional regulator FlhD n=1 Tax=Gilliamella intestini TaxID=1798183 RepID=A0A1C4ABW8_9GAMM|nr:flagellar transcriptional regulator FlhD [Gilliamella intestini]SCB92095.1 flagellar transcriptional activator FlhD [Gilliamella intestini]
MAKLGNLLDDDILKCIHHLNLSTLLLSQKMIEKDKVMAMYRLGIDEQTADILSSLSTSQMLVLSETNQLIFQLRFENAEMMKKLTEESRIRDIKQMHTGILLSSLLLDSLNK